MERDLVKIIALAGWSLIWAQGCATGTNQQIGAEATPAPTAHKSSSSSVTHQALTLGYGDIFEVRVFEEPELSATYQVLETGSIAFPMVGNIKVIDRTIEEVTLSLVKELKAYLRNPQVSVFIKEFRSKRIYVFGLVNKPGTFQYEAGMNIIEAITLAGGFEQMADQNGTYINRVVDGSEVRLEVGVKDIGQGKAKNITLVPGDIVFVPESVF